MKTTTLALIAGLSFLFIDCNHSATVEPTKNDTPYFNQINIAFESFQYQCLLNQWYNRTYQSEPIVFRVINDASTYRTFFPCNLTSPLPIVNFATNSLLIGMKADYGQFINTPVNISQITQTLTPTSGGNYLLQVKVIGEMSTRMQGGEWFAFAAVVPKITSTVNLDMQYQFK